MTDIFARLQQNDPTLVEIDERQHLHVHDFIYKLAFSLNVNTHLRRIVFCPRSGEERRTRDLLFAHVLQLNPDRPRDSSWVDADDPHGENIYCRLCWCNKFTG